MFHKNVNPSRGESLAEEIHLHSQQIEVLSEASSKKLSRYSNHQYFGVRASIIHNTVDRDDQLLDLNNIQILKEERARSDARSINIEGRIS